MMFIPPENPLHNTSSQTVSLYTAEIGEVTVFVSTQNGWTALHLAAQEGKVDVVRLLVTEAQALVNIQMEVRSHLLSVSLFCLHMCLVYSSIVYRVQYIVVWVYEDVLSVLSMKNSCINNVLLI